jgi:DNA sulfur modification protein DndD
MNFTELTLCNFGPYRNEQVVGFPKDPQRNVLLIFGANMRGKTSLLNGIRWVLYGKALGRHDNVIPFRDLVNWDGQDAGDWMVRVGLKFTHEDDEYEVKRQMSKNDLVTRPKSDTDFKVTLKVRKNGDVMRADLAEKEIVDILPEDISRFFLFDAESLEDYETLVSLTAGQAERIKVAIEKVLGVPALINARDHIDRAQKKASRNLSEEHKKEGKNQKNAQQFEKIDKEISTIEEDLKVLEKKFSETQDKVDLDADYLKQNTEAVRQKGILDKLEDQLKQNHTTLKNLQEDKLGLLSDAWRALVKPRLDLHIDDLTRNKVAIEADINQFTQQDALVVLLREVIGADNCSVCDQSLSEKHKENIGERIAVLEGGAKDISSKHLELNSLASQIAKLRQIKHVPVSRELSQIEKQIAHCEISIVKDDREKKEIKSKIAQFDTTELARRRVNRDRNSQELGRIQSEIETVKKNLESKRAESRAITRVMQSARAGKKDRIGRKVEILDALAKIFEESVDSLRDRLRKEVNSHATHAFHRLTTDKSYKELTINERYGLTIIDQNDREVSQRSAGAEQIIALSLIDGLNKVAGKEAPIVMDTPMGRLDPEHRANVLKFITTMSRQVILLVHDGELDREKDLEPINERVDALYDIKFISSSQSDIEKSID